MQYNFEKFILIFKRKLFMERPTKKSIEALQKTVSELQTDGIDPVFIVAALTQVLSDTAEETDAGVLLVTDAK